MSFIGGIKVTADEFYTCWSKYDKDGKFKIYQMLLAKKKRTLYIYIYMFTKNKRQYVQAWKFIEQETK